MEKITFYRSVIREILDKYVAIRLPYLDEIENQILCDTEKDHYQLLRIGFENRRRIHYCVFHFDIIDGKVWVQHDATDIPVTQLLIDAGIPKSDIVLGLHPPYRRRMMPEFAEA
jgi:hypothetical protein